MTQDLTTQPKALPKLAGKEADPQAILAQYLAGAKTTEIASTFGVTPQGLGYFLRKHAEAEWKESQVILALDRKEKAEEIYEEIRTRIEGADRDERERLGLMLSVAREKLKAAQWDLERVYRRIYGADQVADQGGRVSISINLGVASAPQIAAQHGDNGPVTLDHEPQAIDK